MAIRKAYYYKINLINRINRASVNNNYKDIFDNILNGYLNNQNRYESIVLKEGELSDGQIIDRITLDIISNDRQYIFARVSKSKDNKENLIRNMATNEITEVLQPDELGFKTLETYTYFLLDYTIGVLSYIEGQKAASINEIKKIFGENDQYEMSIENIASTETIRALLTEGSTISKIYYDFRIPNPEILNGLGLPPRAVLALGDTAVTNARLIIKNDPRKDLTKDINVVRRLIESLRPDDNGDDAKATVIGKTPGTTQQEYGFELKNYSTPVDIPSTRVVEGEIVVLTLQELSEQYFARMRAAYVGSIETIRNLANL
ncbi:hypothetical protein ACUH7Y_24860 [Clostridium beijerinckii]|uniref:Uncharacterized protein n=1 Tax=Clostridium beijerinckii TaxID=1520 RepID=A0A7X9SM01_CLOBE|nr:hypothetical protein [Clostridium beijerinckii]NMF04361.1 hypothetical protein [Clostridium beijerinckii]